MYSRVEKALKSAGLSEKYFQKFRENEMNDKMVEKCLADPTLTNDLIHVIPVLAHLIEFKSKFLNGHSVDTKNLVEGPSKSFGTSDLERAAGKGQARGKGSIRRMEKRAPSLPEELEEIFNAVDTDRSGRITIDELYKATKSDSRMSLDTCRLMISLFGDSGPDNDEDEDDRSLSMDLTGFVSMTMKVDEWQSEFERCDTDDSGYLDRRELITPLQNMAKGYKFDQIFVNMIVKKFGNGGGGLDGHGFINACAFVSCFTQGFSRKDSKQRGVIDYQNFMEVVIEAWN